MGPPSCKRSLNPLHRDSQLSPATPQSSEIQGLTGVGSSTGKPKDQELVSGMFSKLEDDPDFLLIAKKWAKLSEELKRAIIWMAKQV